MATLLVVVSHVINVKPQHHGVIFVNGVVTVHRIASDKVAETEIDLYVVSLAKPDNVLASALDQRR